MSFKQLPRLYLRGNMMNVTAKELTENQKDEVEAVMAVVWDDPNFQGAKYKFCEALKNTIGGDYKDRKAAEQEARIAIYRAAISVLFHDKKLTSSDKERLKSDPINRKKYFTNYLWMYLRQILRENKIPAIRKYPTVSGPASYVAAKAAIALIQFKSEDFELNEGVGKHIISGINQNMWPLSLTLDVHKILNEYKDYGVTYTMTDHKLIIYGSDDEQIISGNIIRSIRVKEVSFDHKTNNEESELRYTLEFKLIQHKNEISDSKRIEDNDSIKILKEKIPSSIIPIVDVIVNPPKKFIDEYGDKPPKKCHISKFLDISMKEVDDAFRMLRLHSKLLELT